MLFALILTYKNLPNFLPLFEKIIADTNLNSGLWFLSGMGMPWTDIRHISTIVLNCLASAFGIYLFGFFYKGTFFFLKDHLKNKMSN